MAYPDRPRGTWENSDPLWSAVFFEQTEVKAYLIFHAVSKALGRLRDPVVTQKSGCRIITEEFRPIEGIDTDLLGNPFPDGVTRTLKLSQTSWVQNTSPDRPQGVVPIVVEPVLTVVESAFGE